MGQREIEIERGYREDKEPPERETVPKMNEQSSSWHRFNSSELDDMFFGIFYNIDFVSP